MVSALLALNDCEGTGIDVDSRPGQIDDSALAIHNDDAYVADRNSRPTGRLNQNAPRGPRHMAI